jgi:hypothetical protein
LLRSGFTSGLCRFSTAHPSMKRSPPKQSGRSKIKWTAPRRHIKWSPPTSQQTNQSTLSSNSTHPLSATPATASTSAYYYPLYSGWMFPPFPYLFEQPSQALTWSLSRFKQDGLSNIWGADHYPEFMHFVGKVVVPVASIEATEQTTRGSQVEKLYYSKVEFYKCTDPSMVHSTTYLRCSDILFMKCCSSLRNIQDYQMSSNSIYRSNKVCESSCDNDASQCFSTFLENKKLIVNVHSD